MSYENHPLDGVWSVALLHPADAALGDVPMTPTEMVGELADLSIEVANGLVTNGPIPGDCPYHGCATDLASDLGCITDDPNAESCVYCVQRGDALLQAIETVAAEMTRRAASECPTCLEYNPEGDVTCSRCRDGRYWCDDCMDYHKRGT